jgi:hypothetical protein
MAADHTIDASTELTVFQTFALITTTGAVETVKVLLPGGDFSPRKLQIVGNAAWKISSIIGGIVASNYMLIPANTIQTLVMNAGDSLWFEFSATVGTLLNLQLIR